MSTVGIENFFEYEDAVLRAATLGDIDFLVPFLNKAYAYQDHVKGEPRTNPKHLANRMKEVDFYMVEDKSIIVGCFYIQLVARDLHLGLLTVADEYRGKGLAQVCLKAIEDYAKSINCNSLQLDYMSVAPWLKTYYENYGFVENGEVIHWGNIDLVRMIKPIT